MDIRKLLVIAWLTFSSSTFATNVPWFAMSDLPPGAQISIVQGDPHQQGLFIAQLKFPGNYIVPSHHHASDAHATVISGTFYIGEGSVADGNNGHPVHAGESFIIPANNKHYGFTKEETVLQIQAQGPWSMIYSDNS